MQGEEVLMGCGARKGLRKGLIIIEWGDARKIG